MPWSTLNTLKQEKALSLSASVWSVMSMPGSIRQNRSGHTAAYPYFAMSSAMPRTTLLTPKIASTTTMAGPPLVLPSAT